MDLPDISALNVLDPDDRLMNKFQKTLYTHLSNVNNRLSEEIFELETLIKQVEKELESEGVDLYQTQQQVEQQHLIIRQYFDALSKITLLKEKKDHNIEEAKGVLKKNHCKLEDERNKQKKLSQELKNLLTFYNYLSKWENDLNDHLKISKQISSQDANKRKMLINKKYQRDFILYRLKEEIWKVEDEIAYLDEQLQIKTKEKVDANRMIIDVNTDLETLYAERKDIHDVWKSIVMSIYKNNMETNEHLTSLSFRLENDIRIVSKIVTMYNEKIKDIEWQLLNLTKINEHIQSDYDSTFTITVAKKLNLENTVFRKLEERLISNKTAQYVNELLLNTKNAVLENEVSLARTENLYGSSLLEVETFANLLENQKKELEEISQKNKEKEEEIDEFQKEMRKHEITIERKQQKLLELNKVIEQLTPHIGEDLGPQDIKIIGLEKTIQDHLQNIQKAQQFWMRQQGFMVSLSQQRESQLRDINLLDKEIMIMGQKNLKLESALHMLMKDDAHVNKIILSLQQKLLRMNAGLVMQKDLKDELEDKNCIIKNEYILSFQELELELIKLRSDIKNLVTEKLLLKENLKSVQEESLSWEKKVQLVQETVKKIKDEHSAGGIATMKSEIHKMEMRLSYLKKIQEKLVHDMELCVARRDVIFNKVIGKFKKNPKESHNEKVIIHKRLSDQRIKIKQFIKVLRRTNGTIEQVKNQLKSTEDQLVQCKQNLQNIKEHIPNIGNEIEQLEMLKCHNLHNLVLKQRKAKQLHDVKNGTYKMVYKNEDTIEESLKMEHNYRQYLKHVLERTNHDFPMLQTNLQKILVTL
nr:coiled-coil domain-containing protein 40 [Megalopta genalis]